MQKYFPPGSWTQLSRALEEAWQARVLTDILVRTYQIHHRNIYRVTLVLTCTVSTVLLRTMFSPAKQVTVDLSWRTGDISSVKILLAVQRNLFTIYFTPRYHLFTGPHRAVQVRDVFSSKTESWMLGARNWKQGFSDATTAALLSFDILPFYGVNGRLDLARKIMFAWRIP